MLTHVWQVCAQVAAHVAWHVAAHVTAQVLTQVWHERAQVAMHVPWHVWTHDTAVKQGCGPHEAICGNDAAGSIAAASGPGSVPTGPGPSTHFSPTHVMQLMWNVSWHAGEQVTQD